MSVGGVSLVFSRRGMGREGEKERGRRRTYGGYGGADEEEDGHDVPYLVVQECTANQIEHVDLPWTLLDIASTTESRHGADLRSHDGPPKVRDLLPGVELTEVSEIMFSNKSTGSVSHGLDVESVRCEEILVVPILAGETR